MKGINASIIFGIALAVLALVIAGIIASVGASMFTSIKATQYYENIYNESINFAVTKTYYPTTKYPIVNLLYVNNASIQVNGISRTPGTQNITYNNTHVNLTSNTLINVGSYYVYYTYTDQYQEDAQATRNATSGLINITTQFPLIGTILVFGAVIALLLAVFYLRSKGGI